MSHGNPDSLGNLTPADNSGRPPDTAYDDNMNVHDDFGADTPRDRAILLMVAALREDSDVVALVNQRYRANVASEPLDVFKQHMNDAEGFSLLSLEEERKLFDQLELGTQLLLSPEGLGDLDREQMAILKQAVAAYQIIFASNIRLVAYVATRFTSHNLPLEDLQGYGDIGLSTAIRRFDINRGAKFSAVAYTWIYHHVQRAIIENREPLRLPITQHERLVRMKVAAERLLKELRREPTPAEIASATSIPEDEVALIQQTAESRSTPLDTPLSSDDERTLSDVIPDEGGTERIIETIIANTELRDAVLHAGLTPAQLKTLVMRYGLDGTEPRTLESVAAEQGVSHQAVQYSERAALQKLRAYLASPGTNVPKKPGRQKSKD